MVIPSVIYGFFTSFVTANLSIGGQGCTSPKGLPSVAAGGARLESKVSEQQRVCLFAVRPLQDCLAVRSDD